MNAVTTTGQNPSSRHTGAAPVPASGGVAVRFYERNAGVSLLRGMLGGAEALSSRLAERMAQRLFLTPLPLRGFARRSAWGPQWQIERWPFERVNVCVYRYRGGADCDEGQMAVTQRPHVLLMHGWAGRATQMKALAESLASEGFVPIVMDAPAHGASNGSTSNLPQFARALEYVCARLAEQGIKLHSVIAHSLGGSAAAFALSRSRLARSLVLIAAPDAPRDYTRMFAHVFGISERTRAAMQRRIEAQEGLLMQQFDAAHSGPRVAVPTLVAHDSDDSANPFAAAERFMQHLPQAELLATAGLGHSRILKDPAVHARITAFLMRQLAP